MAQLMLVQLALVHSWLLGDLVRDARLVWHWVEGDVRYLSHTCERGEEGPGWARSARRPWDVSTVLCRGSVLCRARPSRGPVVFL